MCTLCQELNFQKLNYMNNIFKTLVVILVYTLAIVTSVYADESCDDAISDGKAAYNSGNYTIAQKHFENVVKWCGGNYGSASNWIQNCKNKQSEIKQAQVQKRQEQEQKERELQAELERKGYMEITDIKFANVEHDGTTIGNAGEKLCSKQLKYLMPVVYYNGRAEKSIEYNYKIFYPNGELKTWASAENGYTLRAGNKIFVQAHTNLHWTLRQFGSDSGGTYYPGVYKFELWSNGKKLYEKKFTVYECL